MRLLVITNDFPPTVGGIENYVYSLTSRWNPSQIRVLTRWVPGAPKFDADLGFEVIREPVGTLLPTPSLLRKARALAGDADAVWFPSSLPLGILGAAIGRPYALAVHGGEFVLPSRLPVARRALVRVTGRAEVVFAESSFAADKVRALIDPPPPILRVSGGVDLQRFGRAKPVQNPHGEPVILSVGRVIARKGFDTLVRALSLIKKRGVDASLLVVGDGPHLRRIESLARSLEIERFVTLAGAVPWDLTPSYYAAADVFALPSRERFAGTETEGLPLVFVEAAAAGLPLIGGRVGGIRDAVRDGENGFLVDGKDPAAVAEALVRVLDPELRQRMGRASRKLAETEFSWERSFETFSKGIETYC